MDNRPVWRVVPVSELPQLRLPLFHLGDSVEELIEPGECVWESAHEKAPDAFQRRYAIDDGHVILTTWRGILHEVIYQTPTEYEETSEERNSSLFEHYGEGHAFNEVLDNGFGKTYRRADMQRYALWGYVLDYTTIGTMEFHEVKWG